MTRHVTGPTLEVGRVPTRALFTNMPLDGDIDYLDFLDDFDKIALDLTNNWTGVKDVGASHAIQADTEGGRVVLTSAAITDNDGAALHGNEIFRVKVGRDIWVEASVRLSDVLAMDFFLGLSVRFTTNPEALLTAADRIGFQIDDGGASILSKTEDSGTEESQDTLVDAVNAIDIKLGFHVTGIGKVEFFVDRVLKTTHLLNIVTDQNLALAFMELSGDTTGTKSLEVDYIRGVMTR